MLRLAGLSASRLAPLMRAARPTAALQQPLRPLVCAPSLPLPLPLPLPRSLSLSLSVSVSVSLPSVPVARFFSTSAFADAEPVTPRDANDTGRFIFEIGKQRVVLPLTPDVTDTLRSALAVHSSKILDTVRALEAERQGVEAKLVPLLQKEEQLKAKAGKRADVAMRSLWVYLMGQGALVGYFTWWEFSWDIMEPITYFIGFGTALIGYTYYVASKREYTFVDLHDSIQQRFLRRYRRRDGYSLADIEAQQNKLDKIDERLRLIRGDL